MLAELQKNGRQRSAAQGPSGDPIPVAERHHRIATAVRAPPASAAGPDDGDVRRSGIHGREGIAGWLFVAPMIIILGLFLLMPDRSWRSG